MLRAQCVLKYVQGKNSSLEFVFEALLFTSNWQHKATHDAGSVSFEGKGDYYRRYEIRCWHLNGEINRAKETIQEGAQSSIARRRC